MEQLARPAASRCTRARRKRRGPSAAALAEMAGPAPRMARSEDTTVTAAGGYDDPRAHPRAAAGRARRDRLLPRRRLGDRRHRRVRHAGRASSPSGRRAPSCSSTTASPPRTATPSRSTTPTPPSSGRRPIAPRSPGPDDAPLIVAGDSAGGNLGRGDGAAGPRPRRPADRPAGADLPGHRRRLRPAVVHRPGQPAAADREAMVWFWDHYVPDAAQRAEPDASPLRAADLEGLPPASC